MSISPMKKLTLLLCGDDVDRVIRKLMYLRCVDITKSDDFEKMGLDAYHSESEVTRLQKQLVDIDSAMKSLAKYSQRKKKLFVEKKNVSLDDFVADGSYDTAMAAVNEANETFLLIAQKKTELNRIEEQIRALEPWSAYDLPLTEMGTEYTSFMLGSLPSRVDREIYEELITQAGGAVDLLGADTTASYLSVMVHKNDEDALSRALAKISFNKVNFKDVQTTPLEEISRLQGELTSVGEAQRKANDVLVKCAAELDNIEILYDAVSTDLGVAQSKLRLATTENCVVLSGWIPEKNEEKVTSLLEKYDCAYETSVPEAEDDPPVLLKNNKFATCFEWVVGMYSYPKYGTYDPTFIMSIFYCILFGMMFADAGYGLLFVLAAFVGVPLLKIKGPMKNFIQMFGWCGVSCIVMGILFGGYFGDLPMRLSVSMFGGEEYQLAALVDPVKDPLSFLIISLGVGAVHLIAGMAVKFYILWRDGQWLDAILDTIPWWGLFAGLGLLFLAPGIGKWVVIGSAAVIVLTGGRHEKNWLMKPIKGLLSLYGLINYGSDLLSYSRILALGLASSIIAQVVNIIGTMNGNTVVGWLMMIVIGIVGHVVNIGLNALGAFVHTSRLQYIEFFGKFYVDGGRQFVPLEPAGKFTETN